MPAPADRSPVEFVEEAAGSALEVVEEGSGRYGSYRGRDRRRIHPRVSVSDRLTDARPGAWTAAAVRVGLGLVTWALPAAPALQASHPMAALLCPLGYLVLEGGGLALVLGCLT